jgi:DnaJ family protein C protein 28
MPSIEDHIRQAIAEGKFDNLSGKGKPLKLEDDPFIDPQWQAAYRMLKSGGYSLPWIETRQEIEAGLSEARLTLGRAWRRAGALAKASSPALEAEWQRAESAFREQIAGLDRRIRSYNLEVPNARFQRALIDPQAEIEAVRSQKEEGAGNV